MKLFLLFAAIISSQFLMAQNLDRYEKRTFTNGEGETLLYRILFPENYDESKAYPLVLFLHGAGERGDDNESQLTHGATLFLENGSKFPAIIVFPQCPKESYWAHVERNKNGKDWAYPFFDDPTPPMQKVIALVDELVAAEAIDQSRLYVTGLSMGGMGTFDLLARRPNQFAAAAPICGGGNLTLAERYAPNVPLWIFHGDADVVVPVELSRTMYERLQQLGADVKYTEYEGVNHNSWDNVFAEPDYLSWLFSHQKAIESHRYQRSIYLDVERETFQYATKENEALSLDIYAAKSDRTANRPTILYVHGGGFSGGNRFNESIEKFGKRLASRGYVFVSMSYRLTMKGQSFSCDQAAKNKILTFQKSVEDIRSATNFLLEKATDLRISPTQIVLAGSSAGAEAILHAVFWQDKHLLPDSPKLPTDFQYAALISMAGALLDEQLITAESAIPSLFFHGTCDPLVPYESAPHHYCNYDEVGYLSLDGAASLVERLEELDGTYHLVTGINGGHEWAGKPLTDYWQPIADFVYKSVVAKQRFQMKEWVDQERDYGLEE